MKYAAYCLLLRFPRSRPARALWIEIKPGGAPTLELWSRPARALWIEIPAVVALALLLMSRPARALWIEIGSDATLPSVYPVEAREGLVD